jgi:hypothetical protein
VPHICQAYRDEVSGTLRLLICGLFNDDNSSSGYTVSNGRMISGKLVGNAWRERSYVTSVWKWNV